MEIEQVGQPKSAAGEDADAEKTIATSARDVSFLVWENVTVVLPNIGRGPAKRLLNCLNGYAEHGRIMAIMGPSGSGKSTLLDALSGRLSQNLVMTGDVLLNGKKRKLNYGGVAYVTQEDVLLGTLTVRETITFSAHLRLPSDVEREEVCEIVEGIITEMGLQDCADRMIGNWHLRGISGGEKKRLSIALEILIKPKILFLDEPTTGLDSAASFFVVQTLRNISRDGSIVICSIHQPSSEVFALFDDLFLLSSGEVTYFGEAKMAVQFFAEVGLPCPSKRNPSDHFLRSINSAFDLVAATLNDSRKPNVDGHAKTFLANSTSEIKAMLVKKYRSSSYADKARMRMRQITSIKVMDDEKRNASKVRWAKQARELTKRSFINMWRDLGYYWVRIWIYVALSICVGTIFFDVGRSYTAILARGSCGAFISGFMTFMSIGGFPSFIEEIKVFKTERLKGYYGIGVYCISNFLSSFPYLTIMSLSTASITYYMVKFRPETSHFVYAFLDLLACIAAVESCMMTIASIVPNFLMGVMVGSGYIGILLMTSGYFRLLPELPKFFWRYPMWYINYGAWGLQGAYKNDLIGIDFDPLLAGDPKVKGEDVLREILGVNPKISKWWDLIAVVILLVAFRILFVLVLKFKEKAMPVFNMFYAKKILRRLEETPPPFPSRRLHNAIPLSSQEGLSSPIA